MTESEINEHEYSKKRLLENLNLPRKYASFYNWDNKNEKEIGICSSFIRVIFNEDDIESLDLVSKDPPDCLLILKGQKIGIELTELVDQKEIEKNIKCKGQFVPCFWGKTEVENELNRIITSKEKKAKDKMHHQYDDYILLIHSDEPKIDRNKIPEIIAEYDPPITSIIKHIYLMLSYEPELKKEPIYKLK
jgi:hypothetical protein